MLKFEFVKIQIDLGILTPAVEKEKFHSVGPGVQREPGSEFFFPRGRLWVAGRLSPLELYVAIILKKCKIIKTYVRYRKISTINK